MVLPLSEQHCLGGGVRAMTAFYFFFFNYFVANLLPVMMNKDFHN